MATAVDFWNEVDRRIDARISGIGGMAGTESADGTSAPPPAAGGLPIHNNAHHEPPLALDSDVDALEAAFDAHVVLVADAATLGHVKGDGSVTVDGDGTMNVSFFGLTDVNETDFAGAGGFLVYVNPGATALEFVDGSTLFDPVGTAAAIMVAHLAALDPHPQYYNQARGDARYSLLGHLQAVTEGGTGLTGIAVDNLIYSSALNTFSPTPITAFGRSLIGDANAAAGRTTLELNAGEAGDIWVEKAGDTMTGALVINLASGQPLVVDTDTLVVDADNKRIGINTDTPLATFDIGGLFSPTGAPGAGFLLGQDINAIAGLEFRNLNTGTSAENRIAISDSAGSYLAFNLPGVNRGGSAIFGLARQTGAFLFHNAGTGAARHMGIGTQGATDLVFGTNNTARQTILSTGEVGIGTSTPGALVDIMHITAPVLRLSRNDTTVTLSESLGKVEFYGNDTHTTTQGIYGNIEVQAQAAIASDAAFGKMLLRTTGPGTATSPVERLALGLVKTPLTDATANNLFEVTLNAGQMAGGTIHWTIIASNGTDQQSYTGIVTYAVVNKAGVYTKQITHNTANDAKAVSSGTLTATWDILDGTNKVTVRVTPTGSLTETTYQILYSVHSNSPQSIVVP